MTVFSFIGEGNRKGFEIDRDSKLYKFAESIDITPVLLRREEL